MLDNRTLCQFRSSEFVRFQVLCSFNQIRLRRRVSMTTCHYMRKKMSQIKKLFSFLNIIAGGTDSYTHMNTNLYTHRNINQLIPVPCHTKRCDIPNIIFNFPYHLINKMSKKCWQMTKCYMKYWQYIGCMIVVARGTRLISSHFSEDSKHMFLLITLYFTALCVYMQ